MAVFQNGPTGQLVVFRVGMDSNYAIETVRVPLHHMEEKVAKAKISQMCETVRQQNAIQKGSFELPSKCPDGTCDGCRFEILWRTPHACPTCSQFDYRKVISSCESGKKKTTYMWKEPRVCQGGVPLPAERETKCSIFEQSVGSAMRDFKIVIAVVAALVVLMICAVFGLWYNNRKLTYKYHRLVNKSGDNSGELPGVERCVVDDDEEDEEEVHFKVGKDRGKKILKKIKDMASGGKKKEKVTFDDEDDEYFESVHLEPGKDALVGDFQ